MSCRSYFSGMNPTDPIHSSTASMYFVAVVCPDEINQKVLSFKHWMRDQFGCTVALKSPAHITLIPHFLGETRRRSKNTCSITFLSTTQRADQHSTQRFLAFQQQSPFCTSGTECIVSSVEIRCGASFHRCISRHHSKRQPALSPACNRCKSRYESGYLP